MCARVRGLTVDVLLTRDGYKKVFYCRKHSTILKVRFVFDYDEFVFDFVF